MDSIVTIMHVTKQNIVKKVELKININESSIIFFPHPSEYLTHLLESLIQGIASLY